MAPRQPKAKPSDDASNTASPLKPKTEKAKVEKTKSDKPKADNKSKTTGAGEKSSRAVKPKSTKQAAAAAAAEDEDGDDVAMKPPKAKVPTKKATAATTTGGEKDGKEKVKSVTGDEAVVVMTRYLKEQNRPYSATEISANLHGMVSKTVADKVLKEMEQSGVIMAKATNGTNKGSQWVFWAKQDTADAASPEELAAMDTSITTLRGNIPALKSTLKSLTTKLQTIRAAPTTTELAMLVETLTAENALKEARLTSFKDGSVTMVTKGEMDRVERDFKYWGARRKARMLAYGNLEALLLDGMTREEIEDKVGVEPDTYLQ